MNTVSNVKHGFYKDSQCINPACKSTQHGFTFDHLDLGRQFGPWYCEACGHSITGIIEGDVVTGLGIVTNVARVEPGTRRKIKTVTLLCFPRLDVRVDDEHKDRVYFFVNDSETVARNTPDDEAARYIESHGAQEGKRYHYEQHTCPWNWLRIPVMANKNTDPHGAFGFVETIVSPTQDEMQKLLGDRFSAAEGDLRFQTLEFEDVQKLFKIFRLPSWVELLPPEADHSQHVPSDPRTRVRSLATGVTQVDSFDTLRKLVDAELLVMIYDLLPNDALARTEAKVRVGKVLAPHITLICDDTNNPPDLIALNILCLWIRCPVTTDSIAHYAVRVSSAGIAWDVNGEFYDFKTLDTLRHEQ